MKSVSIESGSILASTALESSNNRRAFIRQTAFQHQRCYVKIEREKRNKRGKREGEERGRVEKQEGWQLGPADLGILQVLRARLRYVSSHDEYFLIAYDTAMLGHRGRRSRLAG
jgi:hypothetical protein